MFNKGLFAAALLTLAGGADAAVLYTQAWDGLGNFYSSQNDVSGGNGNFATTYDDFTLATGANLTGIEVVGGFFNPPTAAPIGGITLTLYADAGGVPGSAIAAGYFPDNGTYLGSPAGYPTYDYTFSFLPYTLGAGTYWFSAVPDLGFPPQWGSASSASGNGNAYQCFFGSCGEIGGVNLAFSVIGDATVPEPASWALMIAGFGMVGGALRVSARRQVTVTA